MGVHPRRDGEAAQARVDVEHARVEHARVEGHRPPAAGDWRDAPSQPGRLLWARAGPGKLHAGER
jgi:hypothetical protein